MRATLQAPQAIKDNISLNTLGSALARPQQLASYEGADPIRQAALMCVSISQAQAFVDGNKRTAYAVLDMFLMSAGYQISENNRAVAVELEVLAKGLAEDNSPANRERLENQFEYWLRASVVPYDTPEPEPEQKQHRRRFLRRVE